MLSDITGLDSFAWTAVKRALNQRVVVDRVTLLPSRRNRVWIVETDVRPVVVKRFFSGRCGNEFEALIRARSAGLDVPLPLLVEGEYLVLEYVPGEGCEPLINHMFSHVAAEGIGRWLAKFHEALRSGQERTVMVDTVMSNFILSDDKVYGVDLEDVSAGEPLDDLGKAVASILGTEPFFTPIKFDLAKSLLRGYEDLAKTSVFEAVRPFVAKHLRLDAKSKPLFRRTLSSAARSIEKGWPELA